MDLFNKSIDTDRELWNRKYTDWDMVKLKDGKYEREGKTYRRYSEKVSYMYIWKRSHNWI